MGEGLLHYYRTKVKKEYTFAFVSTFLITLLIHLYKFVNTLPNHDSIYNYYADQNILGSGRWALSVACGISSYYDLPWVIGLLSCLFIALTVVVIVALFKLKNPIVIGLIGALLAAAPATTETFFFQFTADGYMIAMFLAALTVYFSRIDEKRWPVWVVGGICVCVACGIYQAYVSFALLLALCYFIDALLQGNHSKQDCLKWVLRQVILYAVSLAAYYAIWKLCLYFSGTEANSYQGISEVGKISVETLINGVFSSVESVLLYFIQWNVIAHGFSLYSVLSLIFLVVMAVGLILAVIKSKILKRKWAVVLLVLCLVAIVPFACIWYFTSDSVGYRPMMLQCLTLLFVLTVLLYERWTGTLSKNAVAAFLLVVVFNNAVMANISYFYMDQCYERSYAEGVEMMAKIHDLQGKYHVDKIAVVGQRVNDVARENVDPNTGKMQPSGRLQMLSGLIETSLLYDHENTIVFLEQNFELTLESANDEQRTALWNTEQVQSMGCWPRGDSVSVINDTVVIKLSNDAE